MREIKNRYIVAAKKKHVCDLCGGVIEVGEPYHYQAYADGADMWEFKSHIPCEKACGVLGLGGKEFDSEDWKNAVRRYIHTFHSHESNWLCVPFSRNAEMIAAECGLLKDGKGR